MLNKLEEILPGSKTYIVALAMFIIGLAEFIDPGAAGFIGGLIDMDPANVLMIAALIMAFLRKITNSPAKI
ncbi:MAG TPA: hypothetical protein PLX62_12795 [Bacteroidales bacterium]|nr:hypothetical protein [Bacteroidales bacterium]